jgi:uncharacterized protein (DUF1684 family)
MTRREWTFTITSQTNIRWSTKDTLKEAGGVAEVEGKEAAEDVGVVVKTLNLIIKRKIQRKKRQLKCRRRRK